MYNNNKNKNNNLETENELFDKVFKVLNQLNFQCKRFLIFAAVKIAYILIQHNIIQTYTFLITIII